MKLSYKLFVEEYGYSQFLGISPFPSLMQWSDFICGIQNCVTFFSMWIYESNIMLALPLTRVDMD